MNGYIVIDRQVCKGCGNCIDACPVKVIAMTKQFNKLGYFYASPVETSKCTGCAVCANMCPEIAIIVYRDE